MRLLPFAYLLCLAGCSLAFPFDYRAAPSRDAAAPDVPSLDAADVPGQPPCPAGFDRCTGGACMDIRTNSSHCGACNNVCALSNATPTCEAGRCVVAACNPGYADCDADPANGCETNTATSAAHCGACNRACPAAGGATACREGVCRVETCAEGFADCDGNDANGCETDTRATLAHCGACGRACARPNATPRCAAGLCAVGSCNPGFGDCDGDPANGCETDLTTSVAHCGRCANACSSAGGTAACRGSACATDCDRVHENCDGNAANGCERDLQGDSAHCGGCNRPCEPGMACTRGVCAMSCGAGEMACGGACVNLQTNPAHCGACDRACAATGRNSVATCAAGACGIACVAGFGDCNGMAADGCETPLFTSPLHCGECGRACPVPTGSVATCLAGACGAACAAGRGNCDGNAGNGCEAMLDSSLTHCGACGQPCRAPNGTAACRMGVCAIANCASGFADCNGTLSDGCELDTRANISHCGACNRACAFANAAASCMSGSCRLGACAAGYQNCNGNAADGCEAATATSVEHCGRCGNRCPIGAVCVDGGCCGAQGLPCCAPGNYCTGSSTNAELRCTLGFCGGPCGRVDQLCCIADPPCVSGLSCRMGRCRM